MDLLIVFVKHPEPGKVKTRIAKTLGESKALELYQYMLAHTQNVTQNLPVDTEIFYGNLVPETDLWAEAGYHRQLQQGADLGERMHRAFEWGFSQGYTRILLIGSDIDGLSPGLLLRGFAALEEHDLVLGPAQDGGYYLIGLRQPFAAVFQDIPWSTAAVLHLSLLSAVKAGKSLFLLPERNDFDTEEDLKGSFLEPFL